MFITKKVQYAIIMLNHMKGKELVILRDVADKYGISHEFLCQIAAILKRAGWLETRGGRSGGSKLIRQDASLLEVLDLLTTRSKISASLDNVLEGHIREKLSSIKVL